MSRRWALLAAVAMAGCLVFQSPARAEGDVSGIFDATANLGLVFTIQSLAGDGFSYAMSDDHPPYVVSTLYGGRTLISQSTSVQTGISLFGTDDPGQPYATTTLAMQLNNAAHMEAAQGCFANEFGCIGPAPYVFAGERKNKGGDIQLASFTTTGTDQISVSYNYSGILSFLKLSPQMTGNAWSIIGFEIYGAPANGALGDPTGFSLSEDVFHSLDHAGATNFSGSGEHSFVLDPGTTYDFYLRRLNVSASAKSLPEPETWALLLLGFGFVGAAVRSRRSPTLQR